jgi:phosphatidylglycerophosphatase C
MNKKLVLFDFDGTITTKDTLLKFIVFYRGTVRYGLGLIILSPVLFLYVIKLLKNWKAKQIFLSWYFKGEDITSFNRRCKQFSDEVIPSLVRPQALQAIEKYKREGYTIAVVSASPENWVRPWCELHGVSCIATTLEVENTFITGKIKGKNCFGEEKCRRIQDTYTLSEFNEIIAYGDTSGDKEMLALAHKKFYKPFRLG